MTNFKSGLLGPCNQVHPCENSPKCPGARAPRTAVSNACPAQRANQLCPSPLTLQPPELRPAPRLARKSRPPALGGRAKCPLKLNEAIRCVVKQGTIRRGSQSSEHRAATAGGKRRSGQGGRSTRGHSGRAPFCSPRLLDSLSVWLTHFSTAVECLCGKDRPLEKRFKNQNKERTEPVCVLCASS